MKSQLHHLIAALENKTHNTALSKFFQGRLPYQRALMSDNRNSLTSLDEKANSAYIAQCIKHQERNHRPIREDDVIVLAQPFRIFLDQNILTNKQIQEKDAYLVNLLKLLNKREQGQVHPIVLVDSLANYGLIAHTLLKKGFIDNVIFTQFNTGEAIDKESYALLKKKNLLFGGSYNQKNGRNLASTISECIQYAKPLDIHFINELVLNDPKEYKSLLKKLVIYTNVYDVNEGPKFSAEINNVYIKENGKRYILEDGKKHLTTDGTKYGKVNRILVPNEKVIPLSLVMP